MWYKNNNKKEKENCVRFELTKENITIPGIKTRTGCYCDVCYGDQSIPFSKIAMEQLDLNKSSKKLWENFDKEQDNARFDKNDADDNDNNDIQLTEETEWV